MIDKPKCARCGQIAETHNWENNSTFWGWFGLGEGTITRRLVRIKSQYFQRSGSWSPLTISDDLRPLCADCWSALVGFIQGCAVAALDQESSDHVTGGEA